MNIDERPRYKGGTIRSLQHVGHDVIDEDPNTSGLLFGTLNGRDLVLLQNDEVREMIDALQEWQRTGRLPSQTQA